MKLLPQLLASLSAPNLDITAAMLAASFLQGRVGDRQRMMYVKNGTGVNFVKHLGAGSYADVYESRNGLAFKVPNDEEDMEGENGDVARFAEVLIHLKLQHHGVAQKYPKIAPQIHSVFEDATRRHFYIVGMEKFAGTLDSWFQTKVNDCEILGTLAVFVAALSKYWRSLNFRHGDMKLNNVMYKSEVTSNHLTIQINKHDEMTVRFDTRYRLALIDFGMSSFRHKSGEYIRGTYYMDKNPGSSEAHDLRMFMFSLYFYTAAHQTTGLFFGVVTRFVQYIMIDLHRAIDKKLLSWRRSKSQSERQVNRLSQLQRYLQRSFEERRPLFEWEYLYEDIVDVEHHWLTSNRLILELLHGLTGKFARELRGFYRSSPYPTHPEVLAKRKKLTKKKCCI